MLVAVDRREKDQRLAVVVNTLLIEALFLNLLHRTALLNAVNDFLNLIKRSTFSHKLTHQCPPVDSAPDPFRGAARVSEVKLVGLLVVNYTIFFFSILFHFSTLKAEPR
jgi:hypothetical protein